MSEHKFYRYSLYALGEVVLVVIGILIALKVNQWNESLVEQELEFKIIQELQSNLVHDLSELREDIELMEMVAKATHEIPQQIEAEKPSKEFLYNAAKIRVAPHFDPNKSGYGLLESNGIGILSNDALRNAISLLYERHYPYYRRYEQERMQFVTAHVMPETMKYFFMPFDFSDGGIDIHFSHSMTDTDYEKLQKDESFIKLVSAVGFENSAVKSRAQRIERTVTALLLMLREEIDNKKASQ